MTRCLNCNKELTTRWQKKFCGRKCSAIYNNKLRIKKKYYCIFCRKEITTKNATKYCSTKCLSLMAKERRMDFAKQWLQGNISGTDNRGVLDRKIRWYLREVYVRCQICGQPNSWNGKPLTLQIDHIDGHYQNNRPDNLRVICLHCHSQTDTYGSKNIGKGRPRYKK